MSGAADRNQGFARGFVTDIWYFAALSSDLKPGRPARQVIMGEPVLLARAPDGSLFALSDICPHRAAPLSAGRFACEADGHASIECPYHGWRFTADGQCAAIPSLAEGQDFDLARVRSPRYPVAESQGLVFIWMASEPRGGEPDRPPPTFPGLVGGRPKIVDRQDFDAHIDHAVVGLMDPAHGPFVHRQWWWRSKGSRHEKAKAFAPGPDGFIMTRHPPSRNSRAYVLLGGAPTTEIGFRLPGLRWEHVQAGSRQLLSLACLTPISATRTRITQILWSDHPAVSLLRPWVGIAARRFLKQDGDMVNLQNQGLAYEPALLWVDDADRQAKWYQSLKREWAASRREGRAFVNPVTPTTLRWVS